MTSFAIARYIRARTAYRTELNKSKAYLQLLEVITAKYTASVQSDGWK
jgi:hypothetical protein